MILQAVGRQNIRPSVIFRDLLGQHVRLTATIAALLLIVLFLGQFANATQGTAAGAALRDGVLVSLLRTPMLLQFVLPHVVLVASALVMYRRCADFEIAILMQNGVSVGRILLPFFVGGCLGGLVYAGVGNPLASLAYVAAKSVAAGQGAGGSPDPTAGSRQVVLQDATGTDYVFVDRITQAGTRLEGVTLIRVNVDRRLDYRLDARAADWTGQDWRLIDARMDAEPAQTPGQGADPPPVPATLSLPRDVLARQLESREAISWYRLPAAIRLARLTGARPEPYAFELAWLAAMPLLLASLSVLSAALLLRPLSRGRWGPDGLAVLSVSFAVYTATAVLDAMCSNGRLPAAIAVLIVPLACVALSGIVVAARRW